MTKQFPQYDAARDIIQMRQRITQLEINAKGSAWYDYSATIAWTGDTTNPVLGDGQMRTRYQRIGSSVLWRIHINMGSTTTYGTGSWRFAPPFPAAIAHGDYVGSAYAWDSSGNDVWPGICAILDNGLLTAFLAPGSAAAPEPVSSARPFTFASGDVFSCSVTYETDE